MKELGIDKLNNAKVIIANDRRKRPMDKNTTNDYEAFGEYSELCPFCRGNEELISEETFIMSKNNNWLVKSVKNKYPIIDQNSENKIKGTHEVIIDTYKHNSSFYNMEEGEFYNLLLTYKNRYINLKDSDIKYICIFKNYMRKAGASLMHPHSQIISLPLIPPELEREYEVCSEFYKKMGINIYSNLIAEEINYGKRVIHSSESYLVYIPEISKYAGDTIIVFKDNIYFEDITNEKLKELSIILKKYFNKMYEEEGNCPFNIYIHTHPINEEKDYKHIFNVHIHIVPRKFNLGGFELSTGMYVSSVSAEELASKYRFD
ncbi:galactose-1-phosphate uridylyltransferase [Terrisporobacter sp.]|uniref:galactose-1-phosphate uridylyltransferase n=1 Tax=Terrisporobacter sp. TaxID=1965305 RepID=UPI0026314D61|nr:DUF4931 domain-containing protein [Terrisporobacter sp.]